MNKLNHIRIRTESYPSKGKPKLRLEANTLWTTTQENLLKIDAKNAKALWEQSILPNPENQ